jgi:hypothetical protein
MLGIAADSYDAVFWVTSQFSGLLGGWWLNRKDRPPIPSTYNELVAEIRKSTFLPNIQDDAINALLSFTQSNTMSYALFTKKYNDYLRRSRQDLTAEVQCVRFITGLANVDLQRLARSHRALQGYQITLAELQNFLNDVVTDSPELGNARSAAGPSAQPTRKRNLEDPFEEASNVWKRNKGGRGRGRGRGRGGGNNGGRGGNNGGRGQTFGREDFNSIANAMTAEERKRHMDEGLCFKCHKKGHRLFQCPEFKGKAPMQPKKQ